MPISRRNFVELCHELTHIDEKAFEDLWRRVGLSVNWDDLYTTISDDSVKVAQLGFLRNLRRGEAYLSEAPTMWDVTFQTAVAQAELEARDYPGHYHRVAFHAATAGPVHIETTRPELIAACVALIAHPDDERYADLVGQTVTSPVFGVELPVLTHELVEPDKGSGLVMCCTFGDLTDVTWWRELQLPARVIIGRDGRILRERPDWIPDARRVGRDRRQDHLLRPRGHGGRCCAPPVTSTASRPRRSARPTSTRRATSRWRSSPPGSGTSATAAATPTSSRRSCARGAGAGLDAAAHEVPLRQLGRRPER